MDYTYLIIWLVLFLILIVIEMITTALAAVWIGIGCLFGAVLAAFGLPVWLQIIASALVSFLCFAFLRPGIKRKYDRKRWQQSLKNLVGTRALVTSEIDNLRGIGEIRIGGKEYAARSAERGVEIPHGTVVVVVDVREETTIVDTDYTVDNNLRSRKSEARLDPGIMDD
ncbi:MAG: NfeD family protein, partial [Lachnospiraceae bacterium]|nr:NfeD family protein [Lachnospiraceae bacterium]